MCGRVKTLSRAEVRAVVESIERGMPLPELPQSGEDGEPRQEAFPGATLDSILCGDGRGLARTRTRDLTCIQLSWGFPVDWQSGTVFNTRIESALEGGTMWDEPLATGRCVVPVASYFEPHATETAQSPRTGRPVKRPYEFTMPGRVPMLLAGVSGGGCVSIVTTRPNGVMRPIHGRMPLMLHAEEVEDWLGDDFAVLADRSGFLMDAAPELPLEQGQETLF